MKTVQGFRHKGNFVVASPHAGFSNVANNAAHSIFLIIPSPRHQLHSIESVAPAGSVCICRFCQWCRPDPVFHAAAADFGFPFLRSIGWVAASSTPRGRAELVRRTSQRNVAMQVSNAFYHWPVHACVLCPQEKWTPLVALAPAQRPLSILLLRCLENGARTLGCPFQTTSFSGVI